MAGRKIRDAREAREVLAAVAQSGANRVLWARDHGIDDSIRGSARNRCVHFATVWRVMSSARAVSRVPRPSYTWCTMMAALSTSRRSPDVRRANARTSASTALTAGGSSSRVIIPSTPRTPITRRGTRIKDYWARALG
jgi:hypothetical protein